MSVASALLATPEQDAADWGGPRAEEDEELMFDAQGGVYGGSAQRPAEMVRALGLKMANGCHVLGVPKGKPQT